jgi:hypothetical protein
VSSSRDEPGRQKPADSGTTEPAKQVKLAVQFLQAQGRSADSDSGPDEGTLYGKSTEPNKANPLRQVGRYRERGKSGYDRWTAYFRAVDTTETETDAGETLEAGNDMLPGIGETWRTPGTSCTWSRWNKSLAQVPDNRDKRSPE